MFQKCVALIILSISSTFALTSNSSYYTAAVVNYLSSSEDNLSQFLKIIEQAAAKNVDIIVFPEGSLSSTEYFVVPDPQDGIVPAESLLYNNSLGNISTAAIQNNIYVVINVRELYNGTHKYNTDVAFDRNGAVVARYRKWNLFLEAPLETTAEPEHIFFETDFGVKIGLFTCFDILFKEPAVTLVRDYNLTNFIFTAGWMSQAPFLYAVQEQYSWSYGNDVNLLAAELNNVEGGFEGSGIYRGRRGPPTYCMSSNDGTKLIIGKVPKTMTNYEDEVYTAGDQIISVDTPVEGNFYLKHENMEPYEKVTDVNFELVSTGVYRANETVCQNSLCCTFTIDYRNETAETSGNDTLYELIVLDGTVDYLTKNISGEGAQICSFLPSTDFSSSTKNTLRFPNSANLTVKIEGRFYNKDVLLAPNLLNHAPMDDNIVGLPSPDQFTFKTTNYTEYVEVELEINVNYPVTCSIYSRVYERDYEAVSSEIQLASYSSQLLMSVTMTLFVYVYCKI